MNLVSTRSLPTYRRPLTALSRLTISTLIGLALVLMYLQVVIIGQFQPPLAVFAGLMLLAAILNTTGWRWTPLICTLLSILTIAGNIEHIIYDLTHPEAFHLFTFNLVATGLAVIGVVLGVGATVQNYRSSQRHLPRGTATMLVALVALGVGAVLVAALPRETGSSVSAEVLAQLPAITTPGMHFAQQELQVKAGEQIAFRLDNPHGSPHSFDIDELNVHVPVAAGKQALILFTPAQAGTYTFYCAVPGHREAGMVGTLVVEP